MYIYFDRNGTIKEVINDESIRRGSSDYNKIYCYLEGNPDIDDIWYLQKNPDGTLTNEVSFVDNIVTKAIPYDAKRDMKYFQDFVEYQFYTFTLTSSYLSQNGLVVATIRVAENNTMWALGELTFNVQANIVKSDNDITQSQYDYLLLSYASRTLNEQTGSDLDDLLDKKIEAKANDIIEPIFDDYKATIDEEVENQNEKIESLGQLQPSGVDTSAHILAFTTDKGIYIGSDTGHWYYWNGSQYVDGGVYQATQIADNSILPSMTKFLVPRGVNLFNRWSVILGYFRGSWDGVLHENSAYYASDFIPVNANTIYSLGGLTANAHISFFDTNKNYISGLVSQSNSTITTPNDCVYMCMSDQLPTLDTMIIENNTSYNSAYYDFYKLFDNLINIKDLVRVLIVDASGKNGSFKSLSKACDYASSGDTILVMPGEYIDESCMCWNKKINIIGVNKDTCKIATSISTYQAPMFNMQIGMIANLSILLSAGDGYCIHSEHTDQVDNTLIIKNCNIISNTGTCIGCGMRKGYSLIIENCYIENKSNGACVLIHDAYDEQYIGDMYPTIINCELISNEVPCLVIQSQEKDGTIVHLTIEKTSMITNATHTYRVVNYEGGTSSNPDDFLGCINWRLDKRSWGNREDTYNYDKQ